MSDRRCIAWAKMQERLVHATGGLWKAPVWLGRTHTRGRCEDRMRQVAPLRGKLGHLERSFGKLLEKRHFACVCPGMNEYQCTYKRVMFILILSPFVCICVRVRGLDRRSYFL